MTKEERETREKIKAKEHSNRVARNRTSGKYIQSLVNLISSFTEPKEKRIGELEESNRELQKLVQQREQRGLEVQEDLLKEKKELNNQLTKAKELIKEMLNVLPKENIEGFYEITEEAEQFLKEVEK